MIELTIQHQHHKQHNHSHEHHQHHNHEHHHHEDSHCDGTVDDQEDDISNWDTIPCHPHRKVQAFDFSKIQQKIKQIKLRKEAMRLAAQKLRRQPKNKKQYYECDIIEQALQQSIELIPTHISQAIKHRTKFIEDKVYISLQSDSFVSMISRIKNEILVNQALANQLNLVMNQVQVNIETDIMEGQYQIHKVQHQPKFIPRLPEPAHRLKLKNMLIKSKIKGLKEQFLQSELVSESMVQDLSQSHNQKGKIGNSSFAQRKQGQIWGDQFHLLSEGTKKAQQFVKKIRLQQKKIKQQKIHRSKEMQSLEVKSAMEHKQFEQQMKKQRHQSLKKRYEEGRLEKKAEKEKQLKNQQQYENFLKEYKSKVPLFKKKQKQYMKMIVQEEQKKRKLKLQQIHDSKKPITREEFQQHIKAYEKLKFEKQTQALTQKQMKKQQLMNLPKKNYFRGKYHAIIHEQQQQAKIIVDPNIERDELLRRQKQFNDLIRKKYAPHISQAKRAELQELMKKMQAHKHAKNSLSDQEMRKLGNQYLKDFKKLIGQLREKGLLKKAEEQQKKVKTKNYLRQVRDKYNLSSIDYSTQMQYNSDWVRNQARKLQKDAKIKQKVIRYRDQQLDIEKYMKQINQINQNYINSAEAKMCLIKKMQGQKQKYENQSNLSIMTKNRSKINSLKQSSYRQQY